MKTLKTTITALFAFMGMILIQGCWGWGSGGSSGSTYIPDKTYTTTTYHFNPEEYFSKQDYKSARPFYMTVGNISTPLLNTKQSPKGSGRYNRFYFSGAVHGDGSDLHTGYALGKRILIMAGYFSSSEKSSGKGWIHSVPATQEIVTTSYNNGYYSTSTNTYETKKSLAYQMEHSQSQSDIEIAAGYYDFIGNNGVWEAFVGYGNGVSENNYSYRFGDAYTSSSSSNHFNSTFSEKRNSYRLFLQNTIGYSTKVTEASIGARITYLEFTDQQLTNTESISSYEFNPKAFLAEPVLHFGIGFTNIKLFSEYAFAIPLSGSDVEWNNGNVKFGAVLKF